jgi:hypothetical protein
MASVRPKKQNGSTSTMPGLVFNEINLTPPTRKKIFPPILKQKKISPTLTSSPKNAAHKFTTSSASSGQHGLMWAGVVSCLLIIVVLSGWALKLKLTSLSWQTSQEKMLLDKTNYSWQKATLATTNQDSDLQQELDKATIKDTLNGILLGTTTPTSAP